MTNTILKKNKFFTKDRSIMITRGLVNKRIRLYSGRKYMKHDVVKANIGFKLGEFIFTRRCKVDLHAVKKTKKKISSKKKK